MDLLHRRKPFSSKVVLALRSADVKGGLGINFEVWEKPSLCLPAILAQDHQFRTQSSINSKIVISKLGTCRPAKNCKTSGDKSTSMAAQEMM